MQRRHGAAEQLPAAEFEVEPAAAHQIRSPALGDGGVVPPAGRVPRRRHGVACESTPNAGGYVPNVQPVEPQGCPADAETWRGLQICEEQPREGYDRDAFGSAYSSLEDDIIDMLPSTMKAGGQVYTPYSCLAFEIRADGTAATDIEHIVALAEAHDSRIADDRRRDIAADLDNLTIADSRVNRTEKSDRDAGQWTPARHGAWFAAQVIAVKLEYGLSVDPALEALLAGGGAQLSCVDADTTSPAVAISSDASAPVTGPFSIAIAFSEPVTGFELEPPVAQAMTTVVAVFPPRSVLDQHRPPILQTPTTVGVAPRRFPPKPGRRRGEDTNWSRLCLSGPRRDCHSNPDKSSVPWSGAVADTRA